MPQNVLQRVPTERLVAGRRGAAGGQPEPAPLCSCPLHCAPALSIVFLPSPLCSCPLRCVPALSGPGICWEGAPKGTEGVLDCLNKLRVTKQIKPVLVFLSGSLFHFPVSRGEAFTHPKDSSPCFNRKWKSSRRFSFRFPLCT